MENQRIKSWVEGLHSCLESEDPRRREDHLEQLERDGHCGYCGRVSASFEMKVMAAEKLEIWTDDKNIIIAAIHRAKLHVFPSGGKIPQVASKRPKGS